MSRLRGVEVMDPAAAVAKFEELDAENVEVAVEIGKHLPRADRDDLPGLDCATREIARVGGIGPNADAVAVEVAADEEQGGFVAEEEEGGWRGRTQGR